MYRFFLSTRPMENVQGISSPFSSVDFTEWFSAETLPAANMFK